MEVADRLLAALGGATPRDLLSVDPQRLLEAQATARYEMSIARALRPDPRFFLTFGPVIDGRTLASDPLGVFERGEAAPVPLLVGANHDEWNWFATQAPPQDDRVVIVERLGYLGVPEPERLLDAYVDLAVGDVARAWSIIQTDRVFRVPAVRLAEARGETVPTYEYLFSWPSPAPGIGACHALEVPFAFDTLHQMDLGWYTGAEPPQALAHAMHRAWTAFAHTGRPDHDGLPPWPAYGADRATMVFDRETELVHDVEPERRELWDGIR
jgi:para-nitrobenzyl esterase